ncbi:DUF445 domain-containing protein [Bergeriella denitrificans]|uniref:Predicted membrane protein n=1 Tax=Bergeriella denitrificans TaxID=494 RepID=A0A378UGR6_BERDE|nr:DUF445 domain-containing protein [Bergeriella denitrificans]STZ75652.1 Predicted membrane protein [Bergeriella denitrificans]
MHTLSSEARAREARRRLRTARRLAGGLLLAAALLFAVAAYYRPHYAWLGYVKAFAEAAMVGALADWFAVTALFRRPFGLPIPHTAILPRKQARIAEELGRFIGHHFLQEKPIALRVYRMKSSEKLLAALAGDDMRRRWLPAAARRLPMLLATAKPEQAARFAAMMLSQRYTGEKIGRALADGLRLLKAHGLREAFFNSLIQQLRRWLQQPDTRDMLEQHLREWAAKIEGDAPSAWDKLKAAMKSTLVEKVDDWAAAKALEWAESYLEAAAAGGDSVLRRRFDDQYDLLAERLATSKAWHKRLEAAKRHIAASPELLRVLENTWRGLPEWAEEDLARQPSLIEAQLHKLLDHMLAQAAAYPQFMRRVDVRIALAARALVTRYRDRAAQFVADKVKSWDSDEMVEKLELSVGRDLQYIRINGTLVGGLVGLVIYSVSQLI